MVALESPPAEGRRPLGKIALYSILLGTVVGLLGLAGFFFLQSRTVDRHFSSGNDLYDLAAAKLDRSLDRLATLDTSQTTDTLAREAKSILKGIPAARRDLQKADQSFGRMRRAAVLGWEKKSATLGQRGAAEAISGIRDIEQALADFILFAGMKSKIMEASERFDQAFISANSAVTAGNDDRYEDAKKNAGKAGRLFDQSKALLVEAKKVMADTRLDRTIKSYTATGHWIETINKMADAGLSARIAEYNRLVAEGNRLSEKTADIARGQVLADSQAWFESKIDDLNDRVQRRFARADRLRARSLAIWQRNIR